MEERFDNEDTSGGSLGASGDYTGRTPTALASLGSAKKRERQPSGSSRADAQASAERVRHFFFFDLFPRPIPPNMLRWYFDSDIDKQIEHLFAEQP